MYNFVFFAVESVKFERPLVTDMHVAGQQRFNGIKHGWTSAHNEEDSMEVKRTIFLAFEYSDALLFVRSYIY